MEPIDAGGVRMLWSRLSYAICVRRKMAVNGCNRLICMCCMPRMSMRNILKSQSNFSDDSKRDLWVPQLTVTSLS